MIVLSLRSADENRMLVRSDRQHSATGDVGWWWTYRSRARSSSSPEPSSAGTTPSTGTPAAFCASAVVLIDRSRNTISTTSPSPSISANELAIMMLTRRFGDTGVVGTSALSSGLAGEVCVVLFMLPVISLVDSRARRMLYLSSTDLRLRDSWLYWTIF